MIRAASQHPALQPSQRRPLSVMLALAFAVLAATVVTALRNHLRPPHHRPCQRSRSNGNSRID